MLKKEEKTTTVLQEYENISNHAHTQINSIYSVFKLVLTIGSFMLAIAIGSGTYFTIFSIKDFKNDISSLNAKTRNEFSNLKKETKNDIKDLKTEIRDDVSNLKTEMRYTVAILKKEVETRVDRELDVDSIKSIIADKTTDKLIAIKITPKIKETEETLKSLSQQLDKAKEDSIKLNELNNFTLTFLKAQSDDSKAYEQLGTWGFGVDKSYPFREISANIYDSIRATYIEKLIPSFPVFIWPEGVDTKTFTCDNFKNYFKDMLPRFHADLVRLISENKNLSEENEIELLIDVLKPNISNSLKAKYHAGMILSDKFKIPWQPFDYTPLTDEWNNRKGTTTTK